MEKNKNKPKSTQGGEEVEQTVTNHETGEVVSRETYETPETKSKRYEEWLTEQAGVSAMVETDEVKTKRRAPRSTGDTLKRLKEWINFLATQKIATVEEIGELRKIHKQMVSRWIGLEIGEQG